MRLRLRGKVQEKQEVSVKPGWTEDTHTHTNLLFAFPQKSGGGIQVRENKLSGMKEQVTV